VYVFWKNFDPNGPTRILKDETVKNVLALTISVTAEGVASGLRGVDGFVAGFGIEALFEAFLRHSTLQMGYIVLDEFVLDILLRLFHLFFSHTVTSWVVSRVGGEKDSQSMHGSHLRCLPGICCICRTLLNYFSSPSEP
jgi:hypothetical protein